ncbi:DUF3616 domain-containing protein [Salinarimonas soli]|uniref:DUF3616 domain-containing protein n=1 Tax=Salinarimonas soli TaxID=1638099 RepID=UPI001662122D|nr:DUF3616 domain-containing protein [Salinarimonas soli]
MFDEGTEARFGILSEGKLTPDSERVMLISEDGELDAEGAALDGDVFYVIGSHSAKRGNCKSNADSRHVIRFRRDPATGRGAREISGQLAGYAFTGNLWSLMAKQPELAAYVGERKCLGTEPPDDEPQLRGQRGANIEAVAALAGRLFFGFRGPAMGSRAPVLAVDAAGLFDGGPTNEKVTMLHVGPRRGIRDMQIVKDGLLVLAGPDDDKSSAGAGWIISLWDGSTTAEGTGQPRELARLNLDGLVRDKCDKEIKPEALTVLEETASHYLVVVLSDGMCDGGPLLYWVPR